MSKLGTPMSPSDYAQHWRANAESFDNQGCYQWMNDQLTPIFTILEIGCGSGRSTLALARKGNKIISIEANETLACETSSYLRSEGISVEIIRIDSVSLPTFSSKVTIVVGDVFNERMLQIIKPRSINFIACWLIGAYPALISVTLGKTIDELTTQDIPDYRKNVHQRCYELGSILLAEDGIIHFVDRVGLIATAPLAETQSEFARQHRKFSDRFAFNIKESDIAIKHITQASLDASQIQHIGLNDAPPEIACFMISIKAAFIV